MAYFFGENILYNCSVFNSENKWKIFENSYFLKMYLLNNYFKDLSH